MNLRDCKIRRGTESKQSFTYLMNQVDKKVVIGPSGKYAGQCVGYKRMPEDEGKVRFRNSAHAVEVFECDTRRLAVIY